MGETTNYKLHLTDDSNERFQDWRSAMNGPNDSNMIKIDNALGKKANSSISVSAILLSTDWDGMNAPFTQTIIVDGLTAGQNGTIAVAHNATAEQREIAREAILSVIGQEDGKLLIAADGELPDQDIPVTVILLY